MLRRLLYGFAAGLLITCGYAGLLGVLLLLQHIAPPGAALPEPISARTASRLLQAYAWGGALTGISWALLQPWGNERLSALLVGSIAALPFFASVYAVAHPPLTWGLVDILRLALLACLGGGMAGWISRSLGSV